MEARFLKAVVLTAAFASLGASYRTQNFVVTATTQQAAEQIGRAAEKYRRELAVEWLGEAMPNWLQPCPITAQVGENLGAGGATSFLFERGEVFGWRMTIQGSLTRILDSVLPHEVTHTIFATHFRRPLPRWADEGACTTVEHASERAKQQMMLVDFLRTRRGIAFSEMFAMKEYPPDVMPLYSQGYSLARFLIAQGGKQKFLAFLGDGMRDENWTRAIETHYSYTGLASLQTKWLDWVRRGSPALSTPESTPTTTLAAATRRKRPKPNLIYRAQSSDAADEADDLAGVGPAEEQDERAGRADSRLAAARSGRTSAGGWHSRSEGPAEADTVSFDENGGPDELGVKTHAMTRPQPVEKSRQVILEWSRNEPAAPRSQPPVARRDPDGKSVYAR